MARSYLIKRGVQHLKVFIDFVINSPNSHKNDDENWQAKKPIKIYGGQIVSEFDSDENFKEDHSKDKKKQTNEGNNKSTISQMIAKRIWRFNGFVPVVWHFVSLLILSLVFLPVWIVIYFVEMFNYSNMLMQITFVLLFVVCSTFFIFSKFSIPSQAKSIWFAGASIASVFFSYMGLFALFSQFMIVTDILKNENLNLTIFGVICIHFGIILSFVPFAKLFADGFSGAFFSEELIEFLSPDKSVDADDISLYLPFLGLGGLYLLVVLYNSSEFLMHLARGIA